MRLGREAISKSPRSVYANFALPTSIDSGMLHRSPNLGPQFPIPNPKFEIRNPQYPSPSPLPHGYLDTLSQQLFCLSTCCVFRLGLGLGLARGLRSPPPPIPSCARPWPQCIIEMQIPRDVPAAVATSEILKTTAKFNRRQQQFKCKCSYFRFPWLLNPN